MALIRCPECNNEISDSARRCPHCGYSIKSVGKLCGNLINHIGKQLSANKKKIYIILAAALVITLIILSVKLFSTPNLTLDDFHPEKSEFATRLLLGTPTLADGYGATYENCDIKFYNIPVTELCHETTGQYILYFDKADYIRLKRVLTEKCICFGYSSYEPLTNADRYSGHYKTKDHDLRIVMSDSEFSLNVTITPRCCD